MGASIQNLIGATKTVVGTVDGMSMESMVKIVGNMEEVVGVIADD